MKLNLLALLVLSLPWGTPAAACDLIYPDNYVAPTNEENISHSKQAFIGHVIGYRLNDGSVIKRDIVCDVGNISMEERDRCWAKQDEMISAILSVDVDLRGMEGQKLFEDDKSSDPGADCGNYYADDAYFLVTAAGPEGLGEMPPDETIKRWKTLAFRVGK